MTTTYVIGFAAALLLASTAPSRGAASPAAPSQPKHQSDTVPLYTNLGSHHKPISTRTPATQQYFDQGLLLVYGFNHDLSAPRCSRQNKSPRLKSISRGPSAFPRKRMSLFGLAQVLRAQGKNTETAAAEARFRRAWSSTDVTLTASRF